MAAIPTTTIGDKSTSAIGYGGMSIGSGIYSGGHAAFEERIAFLDGLFALGERNIDTADVYGDSEDVIGAWLKKSGKRDEVFIATKFGITRNPEKPSRGDPEYVQQCIEKSLSRLGVPFVDLYYLHRPDSEVPIETTVGAMAELVKAGKVKNLGLSEVTPKDLRRAHAVHPIAAVQVEYSPFTLFVEEPGGILDTCKELGIKVVAYSPTGRGLLTGSIKSRADMDEDDWRLNVPKYSEENFPAILKLVSALQEIAAKYNATSAQVCISWLLAQGTIPIPGTRRLKYAEENLKSSDVRLSDEDIKKIRALAEEAEKGLPGQRYPAGMQVHQVDTPPL